MKINIVEAYEEEIRSFTDDLEKRGFKYKRTVCAHATVNPGWNIVYHFVKGEQSMVYAIFIAELNKEIAEKLIKLFEKPV